MSSAILLKMADDPDFERNFHAFMETSILGFYPHSTGSLNERRCAEYFDLTRNEARRRVLFAYWLRRHDILTCLVARDYMIHLANQQPSMLMALQDTFRWLSFVEIVTQCGKDLRALINEKGFAVLVRGDGAVAQGCAS
jgi:hypothetical protein